MDVPCILPVGAAGTGSVETLWGQRIALRPVASPDAFGVCLHLHDAGTDVEIMGRDHCGRPVTIAMSQALAAALAPRLAQFAALVPGKAVGAL